MNDLQTASSRYLELLKGTLTDTIFAPEPNLGEPGSGEHFVRHYFRSPRPLTCVPRRRLDQVESCVRRVVADGVPGDLLEAGVWRGGVAIFMRAALLEMSVSDRDVWVADSFQGLPEPDAARYPKEAATWESPVLREIDHLAVSLDRVETAFRALGLLDERVRFLPGWFSETLPGAPITRLAVLRLDCDLYESTRDVLTNLYDRVSPGGFIIVDDYAVDTLFDCRAAVDEFRAARGIVAPLEFVDTHCCSWRKPWDGAA
jgi:hypothetical protein